jgi:p-aminobenzoyl-glutamate transporter AbgT
MTNLNVIRFLCAQFLNFLKNNNFFKIIHIDAENGKQKRILNEIWFLNLK